MPSDFNFFEWKRARSSRARATAVAFRRYSVAPCVRGCIQADTECGEFHAKIFDVIVRSGRTSIFCGNASRTRARGSWSDARASW